MKSEYAHLIEAILLIALNSVIWGLYKRLKKLESGTQGPEFNSKTLFNYLNPGTWMLRLPFPVFPDNEDKKMYKIRKAHNRLTYLYYFALALVIWHVSNSIAK